MATVNFLTFHYANNYASVLHAYGFSQARHVVGHEAMVVDYRLKSARRYYNSHWLRYPVRFFLHLVWFLRKMAYRALFDRFRKEFLTLSQVYNSAADLIRSSPLADCAVCGSDQVRNIGPFRGFDPLFFLDRPDASGRRRVIYVTTFGQTRILEPHRLRIKEWLSLFDVLSVRDRRSQQMVRELTVRKAEYELDTCLLADYDRTTPPRLVSYIFHCSFVVTRLAEAVVHTLQECTELQVLTSGLVFAGSQQKDVGPEEWVCMIRHAEFMYMNSFYDICFSQLYQKPFLLIPNPEKESRE